MNAAERSRRGESDPASIVLQLLRDNTPFIDLRAPAEFARGALPTAVNLPLLNDEERAQIGRTYRSDGQQAAIALGEKLVSGPIRDSRMQAWKDFISRHPDAWLYCWRGGLRSQIVQQWLHDEGHELERVPGGFKALRQTCLRLLDQAPAHKHWLVLGGRTGSGKTELLKHTSAAIDLEGLANHRGSAFGAMSTPQPQPIDFENQLALALLQHEHDLLVLEDESRTIGRISVPPAWHAQMQRSGLMILEADLASRCANIAREYVTEPLAAGIAEDDLQRRFSEALKRISRRLGGDRHKAISAQLQHAFVTGDHHPWIESLLSWYYDPMYDYQLSKKQDRVLISGDQETLLAFLNEYRAG